MCFVALVGLVWFVGLGVWGFGGPRGFGGSFGFDGHGGIGIWWAY